MSHCGVCNRPLQDPESIALGFGPGCWARLSAAAGPSGRVGVSPGSPDREVDAAPVRGGTGRDGQADSAELRGTVIAPEGARSPQAPTGGDSPGPDASAPTVVAVLGWLLILAALLAVVEYWRWVAAGLAVLGAVALLGMVLESVVTRRRPGPAGSAPVDRDR